MNLQNKGIITFRQPSEDSAQPSCRTLIVSGLARSGTSMVARILRSARVFMGDNLDDVVFEDPDFTLLFEGMKLEKTHVLLRNRNSRYSTWGFKRPHIHLYGKIFINLFRNPYVIITMRDPVAIAKRNVISEQHDPMHSLLTAVNDLHAMARFVKSLDCPTLLISYEKALQEPDTFIKELLDFCGLDLPASARTPLLELIEPNRQVYIDKARRIFDGYIDSLFGMILSGWACERGSKASQTLTLFKDDEPILSFDANLFRLDLAKAGVGNGRHGFSIDLSNLGFKIHTKVSVLISGRYFALNNSGSTINDLQALSGPTR